MFGKHAFSLNAEVCACVLYVLAHTAMCTCWRMQLEARGPYRVTSTLVFETGLP